MPEWVWLALVFVVYLGLFGFALSLNEALQKTERNKAMSKFAIVLDEVVETLEQLQREDRLPGWSPHTGHKAMQAAVEVLFFELDEAEECNTKLRDAAIQISALALLFALDFGATAEEEEDS